MAEVLRRFPDGVPLLDPESDMKIDNAAFRKLVRRIETLEGMLGAHKVGKAADLPERLAALRRKRRLAERAKQAGKKVKEAQTLILKARGQFPFPPLPSLASPSLSAGPRAPSDRARNPVSLLRSTPWCNNEVSPPSFCNSRALSPLRAHHRTSSRPASASSRGWALSPRTASCSSRAASPRRSQPATSSWRVFVVLCPLVMLCRLAWLYVVGPHSSHPPACALPRVSAGDGDDGQRTFHGPRPGRRRRARLVPHLEGAGRGLETQGARGGRRAHAVHVAQLHAFCTTRQSVLRGSEYLNLPGPAAARA